MIDLKSILNQYPNCLNSRTSFKSVLMDSYPTEKRMVNILTILFECGIADKIKSKKSIDSNEMQGFITQIENEYGIAAVYSQDAIMIWAAAFDVTASFIKIQSTSTTFKETAISTEQKPIAYVQGDVDDYEIVKREDGYYIARFKGFEEEVMTIPSVIDGKPIIGIAEEAFKGCVTVKSIQISEGIENIKNCAFQNCKSLEMVLFPNTLRRIGNYSSRYGVGAFESTNLKSVSIPSCVDFIGPYTFNYCNNLRDIELPDGITTIFERTFGYCQNLKYIKLPKDLLYIKSHAFEECRSLKEIHIPNGVERIELNAFKRCRIDAMYIPPTVVEIGDMKINSMLDETLGFPLNRRNMTIYCVAGSVAMEYARKYNIKCAKAQF